MKICIFRDTHPRSLRICDSLEEGVKRVGWDYCSTYDVHLEPRGDMIVAYGWKNFHMFDTYRRAGLPFMFIDLGYWSRKKARSDYGGNHKVVLSAKHATNYFQRNRPSDRIGEDAPKIQPWRKSGSHIVLAGLSAKSAAGSGLRNLEWETWAIERIRSVTDRPILYRPKPSWKEAAPIPGTKFSYGESTSIEQALENAFALVTLHSNAALDALCAGVPVFSAEGLASAVSHKTIEQMISDPRRDIDREQFLADVSYCHWRRAEISSGAMFDCFIQDGLIR